jgi:hypothetical protein
LLLLHLTLQTRSDCAHDLVTVGYTPPAMKVKKKKKTKILLNCGYLLEQCVETWQFLLLLFFKFSILKKIGYSSEYYVLGKKIRHQKKKKKKKNSGLVHRQKPQKGRKQKKTKRN